MAGWPISGACSCCYFGAPCYLLPDAIRTGDGASRPPRVSAPRASIHQSSNTSEHCFFPFFRGLFVLSEIFFHQIPRQGLPRKSERCFVLQQPKTRFASDLYLHRVVLLHALRNVGARAHVLERVCEGRVFLRLRCEG